MPSKRPAYAVFLPLFVLLVGFLWPSAVEARVTRITILNKISPAFCTSTGCPSFGTAGQYEVITGLADGVLDPRDPLNAIIQDIDLGKDPDGKVRYTATFQLVKPIDMSKASGLMWQDVPNRGGRVTIVDIEKGFGDVGLSSGWQGDNSGSPTGQGTLQTGITNDWVKVPAAHHRDGSTVTGEVVARIVNRSGPGSQLLFVQANQFPYRPASLDTSKATLTVHLHETMTGKVTVARTIPSSDWAWASCTDWGHQTPSDTAICLKDGYDPNLLYQVHFVAKDPYVLGVGFAAFRDVGTFFKHEQADDFGTPNPVGGKIRWSIIRGVSQSGNFTRGFLHLGFNEDEQRRQVHDGAWPIIAGRRVALNFRFAMPDGVLKLYEPGSEGPQWWTPWPDPVRGLPAASILDRCNASHSCPKIIEHFGSAEVWGLKLSPEWVGAAGDADIPLPDNVRRYYIAGTQHGGGKGGFSTAALPPPACPSTGYGHALLADNPLPHTETAYAIEAHFRDWVMKGVTPPPSRYPTLGDGTLVDATSTAMGFPSLPGLPTGTPTGLVNPVLDYDFGPEFNPMDGSGVQTVMPPTIKHVIRMKVPKVDADGNELGGVPVVLHDAPLGTYLGWNITAAGFHKGQVCNYAGGMIPFAKTRAERLANEDPRPSLEERYHTHEGYVAAVTAAAQKAADAGFLLEVDRKALIAAAEASDVLK